MDNRKEALVTARVCRFCLSQTIHLKNLFGKNTKDCASLKNKILFCLSHEVFPSDNKPTFICERCKFFMNVFYDFKRMCRQSDEIILRFMQDGTSYQALSWPKMLIKMHESVKESTKTVVDVSGTAVQVSSQDTSESEEEDANIYNVQIGDNEEIKTTQIKIITKNEDPSSKKKKDEDKVRANEGCWPCDECHRTYPLEQLLTLHKTRHHHRPKTIECDLCDAKFYTKADLGVHQLRHSDETPFQCVACDLKFKRLILLKRHERLVHSDLPQHNCQKCPASFLSVHELTLHQQRHVRKPDRNFVCEICDKTFSVKSTLDRHVAMLHDREPEFQCEYCPERFGSVQKLSRHLRTHAGERPYPCKYCDKSFIKSQHYTRHLRVKHRDEVRGTLSWGAAEEAYRCEQCDDTFGTQDDLIYHSAIHATQNLTCPLCQEKFHNVDDVTTHIKSHVSGDEFMCDFCELVFTTKEKYENHLIMSHEDEITNEHEGRESSMDAEPEAEEDEHPSIQVKENVDEMVIEINKTVADNLMMSQNNSTEEDTKEDEGNTDETISTQLANSEAMDTDYTQPATIERITTTVIANPETYKIIPKQTTPQAKYQLTVANQVVPTPKSNVIVQQAQIIKMPNKNENQTTTIVRKEEIKKVQEVKKPEEESQVAKKEKPKVDGNSAGYSDKSLRLLEKELQDLKRTNTRPEPTKNSTVKATEAPKSKRLQVITSTPKLRTEEKKAQVTKSPAIEKKVERRQQTKENKEPVKEENSAAKEDTKKDTKDETKDTPKSVIKNGASDGVEENVRRSTRPSRVKDYAKMVNAKDKSDEDSDSDEEDDDEYRVTTEQSKRRGSIKKTPTPAPSPSTPTLPRKRGRPRKDANKEVPEKVRKDDSNSNESATQQESQEKSYNNDKKLEKTATPTSLPTTPTKVDSNEQLKENDLIMSPSGQTLKKVPIKALPPGVKPMPLPVNAKAPELCEMQIGKKVVKVQKIVMSKAEVEEMAKKGLLEMKDGTMVLKQGIKLPTSANIINKDTKETPKKEKAAPTRCNIGEDSQ